MEPASQRSVYLLRFGIFGGAVLLAGYAASIWQRAATPGMPALVWPAGAIGLAGMILWGRGMWPAFFVPVAATCFAAGMPTAFALAAPTFLTGALLLGNGALKRGKFDPAFLQLRDTIQFLARGALLPMALAGLGTAAAMCVAGMAPWRAVLSLGAVYGAAYATSVALITPAILLAARRRPFVVGWKALLPLAALSVSLWVSFSGAIPGKSALVSYAPFPFLIWAAWASGLPSAVVASVLTVAAAIGFSASGTGPFAGASGLAAFAQIETYITVMATTSLIAGAAAETQKRESEMRIDAANREAEAERLKAQLQPHFLFNCLAAIHSLVQTDPEAARGGVLSLADLLRASLDNTSENWIPLEREMRFVRTYLDLQRLRFEDALEASLDWDASAGGTLVPPMLVQPLVENAIKHGEPRDGQLRVSVRASMQQDALHINVGNSVSDTPAPPPSAWSSGIGLRNLRERLALAYGDGATLHLVELRPGWIEATICVSKAALDEGPRSRG